jgi:hypothetical protein
LLELTEFALCLTQACPLVHGQRWLITRVLASISIDPFTKCRLMDPELLGHLGDRTRRLDRHLNGFFLEFRREAPAIPRQQIFLSGDPILVGPLSGRFGAPQRSSGVVMLVQRVVMPTSRVESWSVLGDDAAPVVPIERYLAYLTDITTCMDAPAARCCNGDHL